MEDKLRRVCREYHYFLVDTDLLHCIMVTATRQGNMTVYVGDKIQHLLHGDFRLVGWFWLNVF